MPDDDQRPDGVPEDAVEGMPPRRGLWHVWSDSGTDFPELPRIEYSIMGITDIRPGSVSFGLAGYQPGTIAPDDAGDWWHWPAPIAPPGEEPAPVCECGHPLRRAANGRHEVCGPCRNDVRADGYSEGYAVGESLGGHD